MSAEIFSPGEMWRWLGDSKEPLAAVASLLDVIPRISTEREPTEDDAAWVHPLASVTGSYLGKRVRVYEGAVVRDSVIWDDTVVGHASEVARSIVGPDSMLSRFVYVGSSIVGAGVQLGGAVMLASRRHDEFSAVGAGAARRVGSLIGDGATVSYGCHVNPGVVIGARALVMPLIDVTSSVPSDSMTYCRQRLVTTRRRRIPRTERLLDDP